MALFGDAWIGGWSRLFWLAVIYGAVQLLAFILGAVFMYRSVTNRPERVFIEENGQAVHRYPKNYGFHTASLKIGVAESEINFEKNPK